MKCNLDYYKIMNSLVSSSYHSLKNKTILIIEHKFRTVQGMALWPLPWARVIIINPKNQKNESSALAVLSHELAHLEIYLRDSWFRYLIDSLCYAFSKRFRSKEEWETDKYAIRKGYARERYAFCRNRDKLRKKRGYMTSEDIKKYAKSIGKW